MNGSGLHIVEDFLNREGQDIYSTDNQDEERVIFYGAIVTKDNHTSVYLPEVMLLSEEERIKTYNLFSVVRRRHDGLEETQIFKEANPNYNKYDI